MTPSADDRTPAEPGQQTTARLLVVDDEPALRDALESSLVFEGYEVATATDGYEALESVERDRPDLVLLDIMMPRMDGLTAVRRMRSRGDTVPVLMLTARDAVGDRVTGLDVGADDYLAKPFELDELLARVRALLRRNALANEAAARAAAVEEETDVLAFADLRMNTATREVTRSGHPVELTRTEFMLLEMFLAHPRQVLTREQILKAVWGFDFEPSSNSLDVYVMYLRRKTEQGGLPRIIQTVRGVGYALRPAAGTAA
ncbi:response regulator transcription factor [Kitasatospora purpeofusca]|uniref:response regulator transcription factor n=1 Tax=Kitasatospora purpeofusca TaxID=67352 RepID=UPI003246E6FA